MSIFFLGLALALFSAATAFAALDEMSVGTALCGIGFMCALASMVMERAG